MKHENHFSRKRRNLAVLAKRLQYLITYHKEGAASQIERLILKIRRLVQELASVMTKPALIKILGATAFIFGISFANQASAQTFAAPVSNPYGLVSTYYYAMPAFADLDNDGDMDLLVGEAYGAMQYYQNTGTSANPVFAAPVNNPFGLTSTYYLAIPTFVDLDNDGDMDLLVGESGGNMQYFKNTGSATNPQFASPLLNPFGLTSAYGFAIPTFTDLDGDGDFDLLVGEYYGTMQYFKNTGTAIAPQFASPQSNPFGITSSNSPAAPTFSDLDGDGDMDLFVGESYGAIQYFKNTGSATNPQFISPVANPFGLVSTDYYSFPAFADLDGDGDMDLLVGEYYGNMKFFKNLQTSIGFAPLTQNFEFNIYPNPVQDIIYIDSKEQFDKIEVTNSLGKLVIVVNTNENQISVGELSSGIYTVTLTSKTGKFAVRKLMKQ